MSFDIEKFKKKEEAQFEFIFRKYYPQIKYFVKKRLSEEEEDAAEDIATDSFIKMWKTPEKFVTEENIKAFLYLVARNDTFNHLERQSRIAKSHKEIAFMATDEDVIGGIDEDMNHDAMQSHILAVLRNEMSLLSPSTSKVLGYYLDGLTTAEIAEKIGSTKKTILNQKLRALEIMKVRVTEISEKFKIKKINFKFLEVLEEKENSSRENFFETRFLNGEERLVPKEKYLHVAAGKSRTYRDTHRDRFLAYPYAKIWMQEQGVLTQRHFTRWKNKGLKPSFIPAWPHAVYKADWEGWEAFLHKQRYMTYDEAEAWIRKYMPEVVRIEELYARSKDLPFNFPARPAAFYKDTGWKGWPQFVGRKAIVEKSKEFFSYQEAKEYVKRELIPRGIDTIEKHRKAMLEYDPKIDSRLPNDPFKYYHNREEWVSSSDFFGTNYDLSKWERGNYRPYGEAKEWVQKNLVPHGINSQRLYYKNAMAKDGIPLPADIPRAPESVYKKVGGWVRWGDYLGTGSVSKYEMKSKYASLKQVREFIIAHDPFGKITNARWIKWLLGKDEKLPKPPFYVPRNPVRHYGKKWEGFRELNLFLQTK